MWLRTILLVLLIFFLARALMRLLHGVRQGVSGTPASAPGSRTAPPVKMVADPVCGTFVVPGKALELARGRHTHYFCSEKCRDQWTASH
jgi:YHS domain-containing protein